MPDYKKQGSFEAPSPPSHTTPIQLDDVEGHLKGTKEMEISPHDSDVFYVPNFAQEILLPHAASEKLKAIHQKHASDQPRWLMFGAKYGFSVPYIVGFWAPMLSLTAHATEDLDEYNPV